jgi:hypothetical protein
MAEKFDPAPFDKHAAIRLRRPPPIAKCEQTVGGPWKGLFLHPTLLALLNPRPRDMMPIRKLCGSSSWGYSNSKLRESIPWPPKT